MVKSLEGQPDKLSSVLECIWQKEASLDVPLKNAEMEELLQHQQ